jgi:hypothetical protein
MFLRNCERFAAMPLPDHRLLRDNRIETAEELSFAIIDLTTFDMRSGDLLAFLFLQCHLTQFDSGPFPSPFTTAPLSKQQRRVV